MTARIELPARMRKVLLPLLASAVLLGTFMAYYNWRLTGTPLLFPHNLYVRTYDTDVVATLYPAHRATQIDPLEAIRYG